jgi:hypothetical protein
LFEQFYSLFQHILTNVASGQFGGREGGVSVGGRGLINIDFPLPLFQVLHGNPGDYAWGQGGLDVVITQVSLQIHFKLSSILCFFLLFI